MKLFLAFVLGALSAWAILRLNQTKPAQATLRPEQQPRGSLNEQMACQAAAEHYVGENEKNPGGQASVHSHYNPGKKQCVGMYVYVSNYDYVNPSGHQELVYLEAIEVFDAIERRRLAWGSWSDPDPMTLIRATKKEPVGGFSDTRLMTNSDFLSRVKEQYGVTE